MTQLLRLIGGKQFDFALQNVIVIYYSDIDKLWEFSLSRVDTESFEEFTIEMSSFSSDFCPFSGLSKKIGSLCFD